jgi:hypothetical protein
MLLGLRKSLTGRTVNGSPFAPTPPFGSPLGIVGWIGYGDTGKYLISPCRKLLFEVCDLTFSLFG